MGEQEPYLRQAQHLLEWQNHLSASNVTRTHQMHQITASSLYKLLMAAYTDYCTESHEHINEVLSFEDWCE